MPVAANAMACAPPSDAAPRGEWACAAAGRASSDHALCGVAAINGLASAQPAPKTAAQERQVLYQLFWQAEAEAPRARPTGRKPRRNGRRGMALTIPGGRRLLFAGQSSTNPAAAVSAVLAGLRSGGSGRPAERAVVTTAGAISGSNPGRPPASSPAAAAAWGVLRVAAGEAGAGRLAEFGVSDRDAHSPASAPLPAPADAFGAASARGVALVPRLLVVAPFPPDGRDGLPRRGAAVVVGGLGGLGRLAAEYLAHARGGRGGVVLAGRSGRSGKTLARWEGAVQAARCDAACDPDAASLLRSHDQHRPALVLHAGGVLDDAFLPALTPARVHAVLAPKVRAAAALAAWSAAAGAAGGLHCFGSVASLVGSPGQGNYSAANAAMAAVVDTAVAQVRGVGFDGALCWPTGWRMH